MRRKQLPNFPEPPGQTLVRRGAVEWWMTPRIAVVARRQSPSAAPLERGTSPGQQGACVRGRSGRGSPLRDYRESGQFASQGSSVGRRTYRAPPPAQPAGLTTSSTMT
jgi:hypothetical protein